MMIAMPTVLAVTTATMLAAAAATTHSPYGECQPKHGIHIHQPQASFHPCAPLHAARSRLRACRLLHQFPPTFPPDPPPASVLVVAVHSHGVTEAFFFFCCSRRLVHRAWGRSSISLRRSSLA